MSISGQCVRKTLTICNTRGLHARASAKFVKCAEGFDCDISVSCKDQTVPGTSIMGLMMLAAQTGSAIDVEATGPEAQAAIEALSSLVDGKFGEE